MENLMISGYVDGRKVIKELSDRAMSFVEAEIERYNLNAKEFYQAIIEHLEKNKQQENFLPFGNIVICVENLRRKKKQ